MNFIIATPQKPYYFYDLVNLVRVFFCNMLYCYHDKYQTTKYPNLFDGMNITKLQNCCPRGTYAVVNFCLSYTFLYDEPFAEVVSFAAIDFHQRYSNIDNMTKYASNKQSILLQL